VAKLRKFCYHIGTLETMIRLGADTAQLGDATLDRLNRCNREKWIDGSLTLEKVKSLTRT
jgi:hypothetical protein